MSRKDVQKAVLETLQQAPSPLSVTDLFRHVRNRGGFDLVTDFELQSALLAMLAVGSVKSTVTSQVSANVAVAG